MTISRSFLGAALLFSALLAGCAGGEAGANDVAVGTILRTDAVIGRVSDGDKVTFYMCGGPSTYSSMTRWFSGVDDASGAVALESDGWQVLSDPGGHSGRIVPPEGPTLVFRSARHALRDAGGPLCRGRQRVPHRGGRAPACRRRRADGAGRVVRRRRRGPLRAGDPHPARRREQRWDRGARQRRRDPQSPLRGAFDHPVMLPSPPILAAGWTSTRR